MLLTYCRILHTSPYFVQDLPQPWSSEPLYAIITSPSSGSATTAGYCAATKVLAEQACSALLFFPEQTRVALRTRHIGRRDVEGAGFRPEEGQVQAKMRLHMEQGKEQIIDAWIFTIRECDRIQYVWKACHDAPPRYHARTQAGETSEQAAEDVEMTEATASDDAATTRISVEQLHARIACVGGVLLWREPSSSNTIRRQAVSHFVETASCERTLTDLAIAMSSALPILLSGPPSSGKTSLLHHLHAQLHPSTSPQGLLVIPLGDSTGLDAKSLIGSYCTSPTQPGQFIWSEGSLARAVRLGYWVVLEDVDKASTEVLAVIKELVKGMRPSKTAGQRPQLTLGNRGPIQAGRGFMLFGTRSVESNAAGGSKGKGRARFEEVETDSFVARTEFNPPTFFTSQHWAEARLPAPDSQDVRRISHALYPRLSASLLDTLIAAWSSLQAALAKVPRATFGGLARPAELRDFLRWLQRIDNMLAGSPAERDPMKNPMEQEQIFVEGMDVFLGSLPS